MPQFPLHHEPLRVGAHTTPTAGFSGGGFLGVGPAEIVVIVGVGWFLLGPQKLFALAKDSGKLLGELRKTADEAKESLNDAMNMDMLAAEAELEAKKFKEDIAIDDVAKAELPVSNTEGAAPPIESLLQNATTPVLPDEADTQPYSSLSDVFQDQLKRVANPNQISPMEIPDLDLETDEEIEFRKLEKQYLEAKTRFENRKRADMPQESDKN